MINLPGSQIAVRKSLFAALDGNGTERDQRIASLALRYLETEHRQCFYLTRTEKARGLVLLRNNIGDNVASWRLWWASSAAFFDVLWTMGVTTRRLCIPADRSVRSLARNVRILDDSGAREVTFPCLRCGYEQTAPVGSLGPFICRSCTSPYLLRLNDGTRVAFAPPAIIKVSHATLTPRLLKEALVLFEATPTTPVEEIHKQYRALIKQYHPSVVATTGDPIAMHAAEEITKTLNNAWRLLQQWHSPDNDIQALLG